MRTRTAVVIAALVCTGALAAPADAHPAPFTVKAGSAPTGTKVALSFSDDAVNVRDTTSNVPFTCYDVVLPASTLVASGRSGSQLFAIDATKILWHCGGFSSYRYDIQGFGTWYLNASDSTSGTVTMSLTNMRAHVKAVNGSVCDYDIGSSSGTFVSSGTATVTPGSMAATYANGTSTLQVPATKSGTLGMWNLKGSGGTSYCLAPNIFKQGDGLTFSAAFPARAVVTAYDPIAVN